MLNKYHVFKTVYEKKSFSKASEFLNTTQPSVSYAIKDLESQLGITLFFRVHNGVIPTDEGQELFKYINEAFNIIKLGEQRIYDFSNYNVGTIKIGVPSHIGTFFLNKYIAKFHTLYRHIKFEIVCRSVAEMTQMLQMKSIDLMIESKISTSLLKNDGILKKNFIDLHHCFIVSDKFNKINTIIDIESLVNAALIVPNKTAPVRKQLDEYFMSKGYEIAPLAEVWTSEMILDLVKRNCGVGYFIKEFIDDNMNDIHILNINELPILPLYVFYIPQFQSIASNRFIKFLMGEVKHDTKNRNSIIK